MTSKRIPKLDAITAMDSGMLQRGYVLHKRQPPTPDDGRIIRHYRISYDLGDTPFVSVSISHDEIMLPFDEFTAMLTARIKLAARK